MKVFLFLLHFLISEVEHSAKFRLSRRRLVLRDNTRTKKKDGKRDSRAEKEIFAYTEQTSSIRRTGRRTFPVYRSAPSIGIRESGECRIALVEVHHATTITLCAEILSAMRTSCTSIRSTSRLRGLFNHQRNLLIVSVPSRK